MSDRTEEILNRLYQSFLQAGERAAKSHLPAIRDAWFAAAAQVARECLALGLKKPEAPRG